MLQRITFSLGFLLLAGCNFERSKVRGEPVTKTWFKAIQAQVVAPHCLNCHSGMTASAGVDLSTYESMLKKAVVPGDPDKSPFYTSINEGRMPKMASRLSPSLIEMVRKWIEAGALEKENSTPPPTPEPPPPPPKPEANFAWLKKNLFDIRCVGCHRPRPAVGDQAARGPAGDVDMTSYQALMDSPGLMTKPIVAGSPDESGMVEQLDKGKMPPNVEEPNKVSLGVIEAVRQWIEQGAKEN